MKESNRPIKVRDATVAGIFYPDDPSELDAKIASLLETAKPSVAGATAILSPHAGLDYSGDLSALAWKSAIGRPVDTIIILSPFHGADKAIVYLPESDCFDIPTGRLTVDREIIDELHDCGTLLSINDIPHFEEHGIELQLPFMHALFPEARLVPILLGIPNPAAVKALSTALSLVFADRAKSTLFVISSDIGSSVDDGEAERSAQRFLDLFLASDGSAMIKDLAKSDGRACGSGISSAFFSSGLASGSSPVLLSRHDSSASRESGEERLVHYAAIAFRHD
jgi:AmmeMemoRadiSam system protein B